MKLFGKYHKFAARITILFIKEEMFEKQNKIISNFKPKKLSTDVAVLFNLIKQLNKLNEQKEFNCITDSY